MRPDRLGKLHRAVDRNAAEWVAITPIQAPGYVASSAPDGDRAEVLAYVTETPGLVRTSGNAANSGHNVEVRGVSIAAKFTTSSLPFKPRAGDHLIRLERPDKPVYRISAALPFGTGRTILQLVELPA